MSRRAAARPARHADRRSAAVHPARHAVRGQEAP